MITVYLYCDPRSLNEATIYYNDIVRKGLEKAIGPFKYIVVHSLNKVKKPDYIYTITFHSFVQAKIRFPYAKTICWFQGIGYEEAKMNRPRWKWPLFKFEEWITVHKADYILFVSKQMKEYYCEYYGYKGDNFTIMPCYNLQRSTDFSIEQYSHPSFAYAGGLDQWQSVDKILDVYSLIEKKLPNASLTLFCRSTPELEKMLKERGINNCTTKFVPLDSLQYELHKHKYGFILREKNWVNLVATPTKMNSYLASYMIPIFSDGVNDFVRNIDLGDFTLCSHTPLDPAEIAERIINFESAPHDYVKYKDTVDELFERHYNDTRYIKMIKDSILRIFFNTPKEDALRESGGIIKK